MTKKRFEPKVGSVHHAADGGKYGIVVVGLLPEVDDAIVMDLLDFQSDRIDYSKEPRRIDYFKLSYRYKDPTEFRRQDEDEDEYKRRLEEPEQWDWDNDDDEDCK